MTYFQSPSVRLNENSRFMPPIDTGRAAYAFLILFYLLYFSQPGDWLPGAIGFPVAKLAGFLALSAAVSAVARTGHSNYLKGTMGWFLLLCAQCGVASFFAYRSEISLPQFGDLLKIIPIVLLVVLSVNTLWRLRTIIQIQVFSAICLAGLAFATYRGGRAQGAISLFHNSNDLALVFVVSVPLCAYLMLTAKRTITKAALAACICLMTYCVVLTYSRGGFLAAIVAYGAMAWSYGIREKRRLFIVVPLLMVVLLVGLKPHEYGYRLNSIFDSRMDDGSYVERRSLFLQSVEISREHPLLGVGPGCFALVSGRKLVTHNTYTQLSAEAGIPALMIFLVLIASALRNLYKLQRLNNESARLLASALLASILSLLIGCVFCSDAYVIFLYLPIAYVISLHAMVERAASRAELENFGLDCILETPIHRRISEMLVKSDIRVDPSCPSRL